MSVSDGARSGRLDRVRKIAVFWLPSCPTVPFLYIFLCEIFHLLPDFATVLFAYSFVRVASPKHYCEKTFKQESLQTSCIHCYGDQMYLLLKYFFCPIETWYYIFAMSPINSWYLHLCTYYCTHVHVIGNVYYLIRHCILTSNVFSPSPIKTQRLFRRDRS